MTSPMLTLEAIEAASGVFQAKVEAKRHGDAETAEMAQRMLDYMARLYGRGSVVAFLAAQDRPELERLVRNELIRRTSLELGGAAVAARHVVELLLGAPGESLGAVSDPGSSEGSGAVSRRQADGSPGAQA